MKVLFVNGVDESRQVPGGGDAVQMRETARALEALGVEVRIEEGAVQSGADRFGNSVVRSDDLCR